jgi:hypothetical protein
MCIKKLFNLIFNMAQTNIHGGLDQNITTALQFTSQMSNYAQTNHSHTQFLTTAALTNHLHTNYINISESGNIYFVNGNGVSFGSSVSGINTTISASVQTQSVSAVPSNIYFVNTNGHSFSSSVNGVSTFYWIKTI